MKPESAITAHNNDQFGTELQPFRLCAATHGWVAAFPGVAVVRDPAARAGADGWLIEVPGSTPAEIAMALASPLPLILALAGDDVPAELVDGADGFILADDDNPAIAAVLAAAIAPLGAPRSPTVRAGSSTRCRQRRAALPSNWPDWPKNARSRSGNSARSMRRWCVG
jgi:hypothetical protein